MPAPANTPAPAPAPAPANEVPRSAAIAGAVQNGVLASSGLTSGAGIGLGSTQGFTPVPLPPSTATTGQASPASVGGLQVVQLRANQGAQLQDNPAALPSRTLFVIEGGIRLPAGLVLDDNAPLPPAAATP